MAEELNLTATFDISGLVEGMNRAAASIQEGASRISAALDRASSLSVTSLSAVEGATAAAQASIKALADTYTSSVSAASAFSSAETNLASANERVTASAAGLLATIESENATFAETAVAAAINQRAQSNLITIQESFVVATKAATEAIENLNAKQLQNVESITNLESIVDRLEKAEVDWAAANGLVTASFDELQAAQNAETEALLKYAGVISETQAKEAELAAQQATRAKEAAAAQVAAANEAKAAQIAAAEAAETANTKWAASQGIVTESVEGTTGAIVLDSESVSGLAGQNEIAAEETLVYDEAIQDLNANMEKQSELLEAQTVAWADSLGIITSEVPAAEAAELALSEATEKYVASLENAEVANAKWAASQGIATTSIEEANAAIAAQTITVVENSAAENANVISQAEVGSAIDLLTSKEGQAALATRGLTVNILQEGEAANVSAAANNNLTRALGQGAAGMLAMEAGAGRMAFIFRQLAAQLPSVATLMSAVFVPILILTVADIIESFYDKFKKLQEGIRDASVAMDDLTTSQVKSAAAIDLENMKLDDQISKLAGGTAENKLAEDLLQARMRALDLSKALEDATDKMVKLLEKQEITTFRSFLLGQEETTPFLDKIRPVLEALIEAQRERADANADLILSQHELDKAVENGDTIAAAKAQADIDRLNGVVATTSKTIDEIRANATRIVRESQAELAKTRAEAQGPQPNFAAAGGTPTQAVTLTEEDAKRQSRILEDQQDQVIRFLREGTYREDVEADRTEKSEIDHSKSRIAQWQAELDEKQNLLDTNHVLSLDGVLRFWENVKAREDLSVEERDGVARKITEIQSKQSSDQFKIWNDMYRADLEAVKGNAAEKVRVIQDFLEQFNAANPANKPQPDVGMPVQEKTGITDYRKKILADLAAAEVEAANERIKTYIREDQEKFNSALRGSQERINISNDEMKYLEANGKRNTDAFKAAEKENTDAKRENSIMRMRLADEEASHEMNLALIQTEADRAHYEATTTETEKRTSEGIAREEAYNDAIYEIHKARLLKELELEMQSNTATMAQIEATTSKIEELEGKHAADRKAIEDRRQRDRMTLENSVNATLERGIAGAITGMLTNYKNFQSALRGIYDGILADFAAFLAKKVQHWIEHLILEKLWARIFGAQDTGTTPEDEAKKKIKANTATARSDAAAASANTLALDSMTELPPIPEVKAAAVYTLGLGLASLSAAAGTFERGGITGPGITPAFLHPREMVLDSRLSEGMQNLILNSGSPAVASRGGVTTSSLGATGGHTFNFPTHIGNLSALDGASVKATLEAHGDTIGKVAVAKVKNYFRSNGVIK